MRFFFYGTLMLPEILGNVIGRKVEPTEMTRGAIAGYSRRFAMGAPFPVLVPAYTRSQIVEGVMWSTDHMIDALALSNFEGRGYKIAVKRIYVDAEDPEKKKKFDIHPCFVFMADLNLIPPTDNEWTLDRFNQIGGRNAMLDAAD